MRALVTVKQGRQHNARRDGRPVTYSHGDEFVVSQHVLENFKDRLVKIRDVAADEVAPAPAGGKPTPPAPRREPKSDQKPAGTKSGLVVSTPGAGAEHDAEKKAGDEGGDDDQDGGDESDPLVAALASVGHNVDPAAVEAWSDDQRERAAKLVERGGGNPPKFVLEAAGA